MQRESEECEPAHAREGSRRLGLGCHPAAERLAAGEQRQVGGQMDRGGHGHADRRMGEGRPVRSFRSDLHVGELEAQRRDPARCQSVCDRRHEAVRHARAGAVRQNHAGKCPPGDLQES
jgi:hypothetical protein